MELALYHEGMNKKYPIPNVLGEITVGRAHDNTIVVNASALVSRRHCVLERHKPTYEGDSGIYIRDLGSMNGTLVDGQIVKDTPVYVPVGANLILGVSFGLELINEGDNEKVEVLKATKTGFGAKITGLIRLLGI